LLGKWTRLAQGHVLVGGNCSCGFSGGNLQVADFEQQILDYLGGRYAWMGKSGSISELLREIATQPKGDSLALLADLDRTLESFDETHRTR
jgi:hypothetical protein